jgi:ferritin-like metal-binding protein YciE
MPYWNPRSIPRLGHLERHQRSFRFQRLEALYGTGSTRTTHALKQGIELHIEQTQTQIERLEQAMEKMEMKPGRKVCEAMRGLVEEAQNSIEEQEKGPIMDLVIVAGMQRIEHYEISAYGTNIAFADALGEKEVSALLNATLKEEKETDLILTDITQKNIMPEAMGGDGELKPRRSHVKESA